MPDINFKLKYSSVISTMSKTAESNNSKATNQSEPNDGRKIYVGNLPFGTSVDDLVGEFSKFGKITDKQIPVIRQVLKGFAYIEYEDVESAQNAINSLNDTDFNGRQIKVDMQLENTGNVNHNSRGGRKYSRSRGGYRGNKPRTDNPRKSDHSEKEQTDSEIPVPRINSENEVHSEDDQQNAESLEFDDLENTEDQKTNKNRGFRGRGRGRGGNNRGRSRGRKNFRQRDNTPSLTTLYISNLPESATDEALKEIFKDFKVISVEVMTHRSGQAKGYAFVEFETSEEQQNALKAGENMYFGDNQLTVKVALGHRHEKHAPENNSHDENES